MRRPLLLFIVLIRNKFLLIFIVYICQRFLIFILRVFFLLFCFVDVVSVAHYLCVFNCNSLSILIKSPQLCINIRWKGPRELKGCRRLPGLSCISIRATRIYIHANSASKLTWKTAKIYFTQSKNNYVYTHIHICIYCVWVWQFFCV